jgi:hypothetical protein
MNTFKIPASGKPMNEYQKYFVESQKKRKKVRRDSYTESLTYIVFMDAVNNFDKLYFKIGKTISLEWRLRQLQTANPIIGTVSTIPFDCEKYLHINLKAYKVRKEWFCMKDLVSAKDVLKKISLLIIEYQQQYL